MQQGCLLFQVADINIGGRGQVQKILSGDMNGTLMLACKAAPKLRNDLRRCHSNLPLTRPLKYPTKSQTTYAVEQHACKTHA